MAVEFDLVENTGRREDRADGASVDVDVEKTFDVASAEAALRFHRSIPGHEATELVSLDVLAAHLGVARVWVKDESSRFGLNAFKGLGGSYAAARVIADRLGIDPANLTFDLLTRPDIAEKIARLTFVTATDGNHGRGLAWTCRMLGAGCVVYMPRGSAAERLENIRAQGAQAQILDLNYDDSVRFAAAQAQEHGWVLVQDTSWDGYEQIPTWIMQGYTTMGLEAAYQLGNRVPTHVFLQAGVGAMSGAITGFLANYYGREQPRICIVEPNEADCVYRTAAAGDGRLHAVAGDLPTMMAGLACGEPCGVGWRQLERSADFFASVPDEVAARGMRVLANPLPGDETVVSGESGAVTLGFLATVLSGESAAARDAAARLGLGLDSRVLLISTEGATDRANYRRVLWGF